MANKMIQLTDGDGNVFPKQPINSSSLLKSTSERISINPSTGSNYSGYGNSYYYKEGTKVHLHLGLQGLSTSGGNTITTLPTGYRPVAQLAFVGVGGNMTVNGMSLVLIASNGVVTVYGGTAYSSIDCEWDAMQ